MYTRNSNVNIYFSHNKNIITHHLFTSVSVVYCSLFWSVHMEKNQTIGQNVKSILIERPFLPPFEEKDRERERATRVGE